MQYLSQQIYFKIICISETYYLKLKVSALMLEVNFHLNFPLTAV